MADEFDALVTRLLGVSDISYVPPPFAAEVAEAVLGPSGMERTPHRRLLERMNGGYFYGRALHIFGACARPDWHSLAAWNGLSLWRDAYGKMAEGLVFFAEDAFGDQYAYTGHGGEVVAFEAELGRVATAAPHFRAWLEAILDAPEAVLPVDVVQREAQDGRRFAPGFQLFAYPPLCTREAHEEGVTIGHVDAIEAMRFRGSLAQQLSQMPQGSRVKIEIPED